MSEVTAVRSWITNPDTGALIPVFTAEECRILIDCLDYQAAAGKLTDDEYRVFREAQAKLVLMEHTAKRDAS